MGRVRRFFFVIVGVYLLAAVATRTAEASGAWRSCGCADECWCRQPGLTLFRWVTPFGKHRSLSAEEKEVRAAAAGMA